MNASFKITVYFLKNLPYFALGMSFGLDFLPLSFGINDRKLGFTHNCLKSLNFNFVFSSNCFVRAQNVSAAATFTAYKMKFVLRKDLFLIRKTCNDQTLSDLKPRLRP